MPDRQTQLCEVQTSKGPVLIPYELQRRKGMRHLKVSVDVGNRVTLKVPYRVSEAQALSFLRTQGDWLMKVIGRAPRPVSLKEFLERQGSLAAHGERVALHLRLVHGRCRWSRDSDGALHFGIDPAQDMERQLVACLRAFAREVLPQRAVHWSAHHALRLRRVTVRDQRTLWGSCTDRATLSLNWRLVLIPPQLQDHIVLHELAHLTHLDHSPAFWALLHRYDPHCTQHDREITRISPAIMRLGRT